MIIPVGTEAERAQARIWLAEARQAYADLMSGNAIVSVSTPDDTTQYTRASAQKLQIWIQSLERALGQRKQPRPRARGFNFG